MLNFMIMGAQTTDSTQVTPKSDFMYDLGIGIEPERESSPLTGKQGVANHQRVLLQDQIDSLALALDHYQTHLQEQLFKLEKENDSLKTQIRRLQNHVFLSPYAALSPRVEIYSKEQGEAYFKKGRNAYHHNNHAVAIDYFNKTLTSAAASAMIGAAYYWIGESYIALQDHYLALEYLKKVMEYPLTEKADDALFLAAVTYHKLGNPALAEIFFKRLTTRYPDSKLSKLALLELKRIKQGE